MSADDEAPTLPDEAVVFGCGCHQPAPAGKPWDPGSRADLSVVCPRHEAYFAARGREHERLVRQREAVMRRAREECGRLTTEFRRWCTTHQPDWHLDPQATWSLHQARSAAYRHLLLMPPSPPDPDQSPQ